MATTKHKIVNDVLLAYVVGTLFNWSSCSWFHVHCYGARDISRSWYTSFTYTF